MKTFLKVVLLLIAVLVAVKLLPLVFGALCLVATGLAGIFIVAGSIVATVLGFVLVVVALLSPIWIPVLALVGLIALIRSSTKRSSGVTS